MLRASVLRCRLHSCLRHPRLFSTSVSSKTNIPPRNELYEQTGGRWLFNDAQQQDIRRINFYVIELIRVACAAVGASSCLSIQKIAEGTFNKVFRLCFDNSQSVVARLPSSRMFGSGVSWVIASEVATMTLVRENYNISIPRVLAWSKESDANKNTVGWPYILMEDIDGVSLEKEWRTPEMRGTPVAELLTRVSNSMHRMTIPPFSQLGSLYFPNDLPSAPSLAAPMVFENQVRVGPIADFMWWRSYHDEPHLDRGPWDTLEDYINAAVYMERRAIERHREDPSSLSYTMSSMEDLDQIERLLDKVTALSPHLQRAIESTSPFSALFMQNILFHPDICAQNIMVPKLTAENSVTRMKDPVFIDWQGTTVLPLAVQWCVPPIARYDPRLFQQDGRPLLEVRGIDEVEWPSDMDELTLSEQEVIRAEHRIATRHVRWVENFVTVQSYAHLFILPLQRELHFLTQGILRAVADGPNLLMLLLVDIKTVWDENSENWGPCPYTLEADEVQRYEQERERQERFDAALSRLVVRLSCTHDGCVDPEDYDVSMRELECARLEWDEETCGGPFPYEEGRWGQYLR
ncbi:hypothetical protein BDN70DRAFT_827146 [Pholiota conissans]|uniref:Altered inheritance of mitochondria protein 9, mitochondrial n=1 Tax=Pholiota conissans TaxID=109636 RepID=A0A9P5ZBW5_9AGAR|nr:hypothetical protein BDN70DRAFT_827146 [Pholiota conissans]